MKGWRAERGSELAKLRIDAHRALDQHWKSGEMSRKQAYAALASRMNISQEVCHIGMFDEDRCKIAIYFCENGLKG